MAKTTIIFAVLLIGLGLAGYFSGPTGGARPSAVGSGPASQETKPAKRSITALIPAVAGGLLLVCGGLAFDEGRRMHAMHGAALVGVLGFLAAAGRGSMGLVKLLSADSEVNLRSLAFVWMMAVLCGVFVALCVKSFVQARMRRREAEQHSA